jgi:hypothetical protein
MFDLFWLGDITKFQVQSFKFKVDKLCPHLFLTNEPMLQHLGIAREDILLVHCLEENGVEDDGVGIVENTNLIFQSSEVDACLATHRGIDH